MSPDLFVVFPNSFVPSAANAQANDAAFRAALWDFVRTLARYREDASLPSDDPADLVDMGGGIHAPHVAPTQWAAIRQHPTLSQWATPIRPLLQQLVDVNNADTTTANRAKRIRTALVSGATVTRPSDGAVIANSFWTTDSATTLTRWQRMASLLALGAPLTSDWDVTDPIA